MFFEETQRKHINKYMQKVYPNTHARIHIHIHNHKQFSSWANAKRKSCGG